MTDVAAEPITVTLPPAGYTLGELIGRGGMGEVIAAHDRRFDREVALKRMHGDRSSIAVARFLREARIQAKLDHPAIVPIHELGVDEAGRPYFTMKRLAGTTLAHKLADGAPPQPLLRAFVEVCLAIELAHTRRFVHRDLKPANIVLGDFGEVYVLDWGLALALDERVPAIEALAAASASPAAGPSDVTEAGAVLGTPGYMAPEQIRGEEVGPPADIYALGSILFEILAGERLHPRGKEAYVTTLTNEPQPPSARRPDLAIAPELDEACHAALADDPAARPTARELADRIRRYIDGDRDLERRRELAAERLREARDAMASADPDARLTAIRHAGRALALDPESAEAAGLVTQLVIERPAVLPAQLVDSLRDGERDTLRMRERKAVFAYGAVLLLFVALIPLLGVVSWPWLIAFCTVQLLMIGFAASRVRTGAVNPLVSMIGNCALAVVWSRVAGPFILTPVLICGALIAIASHPWNQRRPWTLFAWIAGSALAPLVLEWLAVFDASWSLTGGGLLTMSHIYRLDGAATEAAVVIAHVLPLLLVGSFAYTVTRTAREARRSLHIQAWHLRHLLPESHPASPASISRRPAARADAARA